MQSPALSSLLAASVLDAGRLLSARGSRLGFIPEAINAMVQLPPPTTTTLAGEDTESAVTRGGGRFHDDYDIMIDPSLQRVTSVLHTMQLQRSSLPFTSSSSTPLGALLGGLNCQGQGGRVCRGPGGRGSQGVSSDYAPSRGRCLL